MITMYAKKLLKNTPVFDAVSYTHLDVYKRPLIHKIIDCFFH
ncbi:hypothetical protein A5853_001327 [Enterococcus faecium]|nr:hypothetical protein A5853_001327 [Enterococcus faecium]